MTRKMLGRGVCLGMSVLLCTACAFRPSPRAAFGARPPAGDSLADSIAKVRRLSMAAGAKRGGTSQIETENPALREALLALASGATPSRHRRVAEAYRQAGVQDVAYRHYVAARDLDSHDASAYDGLARIWRDWGLPHLGLGDASRAIYYAPGSPGAYNTFGTLLYALGQTADARRAFERAVALDPSAAYAWTNLCYLSFQAGDLDSAGAGCRRALALAPGFVPAHNNLALVYAAAGDLGRADAEFQATGVEEAVRHYNLGIVLSAARRYAEAVWAFEAAERLRPGWTSAAERVRQTRGLAQTPSRTAGMSGEHQPAPRGVPSERR